jgi:hypothetical protein
LCRDFQVEGTQLRTFLLQSRHSSEPNQPDYLRIPTQTEFMAVFEAIVATNQVQGRSTLDSLHTASHNPSSRAVIDGRITARPRPG